MKFSFKNPLLFALVLVALMLPELAFAANLFEPTAGDKSREWFIRGLFGGLDTADGGSGGGADPLEGIIGVFNSAVLMIGGVLLFYTLVGGTVRTAGEGKVLGRWDSVWLPIRTVLGVAAIVPVKGGYAIIQYAVIWLAIQGIGIADQMTSKFLDNAASQNNQYNYTAANIKSEISDVVRQMVLNASCVAIFDSELRQNADDTRQILGIHEGGNSVLVPGKIPLGVVGIDSYQIYRFGCGSITFPVENMDSQIVGNRTGDLQLIDQEKLGDLRKAMWNTHQAQMQAALSATASIGAQVANHAYNDDDPIQVAETIDNAVNNIAETWAQAAAQTASAQSMDLVNRKLVDAIKNDGWLVLGSWYMQITLAQQAVTDSMSILPDVSTPDGIIDGARSNVENQGKGGVAGVTGAISSFFSAMVRLRTFERVLLGEASGPIMYAVRVIGTGNAVAAEPGTSSSKGMLSNITRQVTAAFTGIDVKGSDKNPVVLATEIGSRLIISTAVAIGVFAIAAGTAGVTATIGTNVVLVAVSILSPLLVAMLGAGLTLSYYIPMLPYILWLGAVFGWVILVVEAVIAAPLWAVTHLAPDGDGVVGRGGQGYMLVLSLTMRPALMVFGFAAAVAVMNPMGKFVNETFMGAFFGSVSSGMVGMFKMLAGAVIYATVMMMIINRVFSLIHQIPDGILRWIGGGDNIIGREAEQASSGAGKAIAAGTAAAGAMGAMQNAGKEIGGMAREQRIQKANRLNTAASTAAQLAGNAEDKASRGMNAVSKGVNGLEPGAANFEDQEEGLRQQLDSASVASVQSVARAAEATLATDRASSPGDPNRPSQKDVQAARSILDSIKESGADRDGSAAKSWLASSAGSGKYGDSKFGSQIGMAAGNVAAVEGKLSSTRKAHDAKMSDMNQKEAISAVGGIHASAMGVIEQAGTEGGPTQDEVNDAVAIRDSIENSGALHSGSDAQKWLSSAAEEFGNSSFGEDISLAASRATGGRPSGGGNPGDHPLN